jgi:solute carrier family 32 (vesicular inhibitory amino acid transporter)
VKITEIQAAWNVTNAIQGMFIVSLPFAVLRGGYWAIIAMVGIAHICCYTGKVKMSS